MRLLSTIAATAITAMTTAAAIPTYTAVFSAPLGPTGCEGEGEGEGELVGAEVAVAVGVAVGVAVVTGAAEARVTPRAVES